MITNALNQIEQFEENLERQKDFLTQKIKAEYRADPSAVINKFYCFGENNLMMTGENLSVCGNVTEENLEELLSFCQFTGVYGLECSQPDLPLDDKNTMHLMKYVGEQCENCDQIIKNENIYQFSQFCCTNFSGVSFSTVYSYLARKVNKAVSDIYYLQDNGKIVSGALATSFDDSVYLTFVSTDKKMRKQGLAKKVINHIINQCGERNVTLMCETELLPFYAKLGFEKTGEIYLYQLRKEHI